MSTGVLLPRSATLTTARPRGGVLGAYVVGLVFNAGSLLIGNPYIVFALAVAVAALAVVRLRSRRAPWVVLASTLAANPVNLSATIACNLVIAAAYATVALHRHRRVPAWTVVAAIGAVTGVLLGAPAWSLASPDAIFTQLGALMNYIIGPMLLLPILYSGIAEDEEWDHVERGILPWLVLPTLVLLAAARAVGTPVSDAARNAYDYQIFSVYRLAAVEVTLTRTHVGIVVATLFCAALPFFLVPERLRSRWLAITCLAVAGALMLFTASVGSALALLTGVLAVVAVGRRRVGGLRLLVGAAVLAVLSAFAWRLIPEEVLQYVIGRYNERFAFGTGIGVSDRLGLWVLAAQYAAENPMGVGWGLFIEPLGIYPHNDYLTYAIAFGVLPAVAYLYVVARLVIEASRRAWSMRRDVRFSVVAAGLGSGMVLLVNSFSDHLSSNRWYFNVVWSIVWFCYFGGSKCAAPNEAPR